MPLVEVKAAEEVAASTVMMEMMENCILNVVCNVSKEGLLRMYGVASEVWYWQ